MRQLRHRQLGCSVVAQQVTGAAPKFGRGGKMAGNGCHGMGLLIRRKIEGDGKRNDEDEDLMINR